MAEVQVEGFAAVLARSLRSSSSSNVLADGVGVVLTGNVSGVSFGGEIGFGYSGEFMFFEGA